MFSRERKPRIIRKKEATQENSTPGKREKTSFTDPIDELSYLFHRLSVLVEAARDDVHSGTRVQEERGEQEHAVPGRTRRLLFRQRKGSAESGTATQSTTTTTTTTTRTEPALASVESTTSDEASTSVASTTADAAAGPAANEIPDGGTIKNNSSRGGKKQAIFVNMGDDEDECIEIIRRIAELVVVSERVVASYQAKEEKKRAFERSMEWGSEIIDDKISGLNEDMWKDDAIDVQKYLPVFETFFERNGLAQLVDIVTGASFRDPIAPAEQEQYSDQAATDGDETDGNINDPDQSKAQGEQEKKDKNENETEKEKEVLTNPQDSCVNRDENDNIEKETSDRQSTEKKVENDDDNDDAKAQGKETSVKEGTLDDNMGEADTLRYKKKQKGVACTKLPPLRVATQAIQSVSIMVQNVSRATSLYFILSNNHINELIDFPLEGYSIAETNRLNFLESKATATSTTSTTKTSLSAASSPELAELTTHFVTFLKSLALRMNAETLQFFLKYPSATDPNSVQDVTALSPSEVKIEFPLYGRALEFCSADHDSMVRLTAMNICMNTLRLTTVVPSTTRKSASSPSAEEEATGATTGEDGNNNDNSEASAETYGSSPDGILHNAKPLPFRERLAISQHTCAPFRVERLIAPIFTKLAGLWSTLEEEFIEIDSQAQEMNYDDSLAASEASTTVANNKKSNSGHLNTIRDIGADIQDQLLVLEDVLKVGLTALNEQIIEMMLATFVYPLCLQPILLYYRRLPLADAAVLGTEDPFSDEMTKKKSTVSKTDKENADDGEGEDTSPTSALKGVRAPPHVSAPAKTAFFTLSAVFQFISNRPLLRLLFTALFHPLLPDSSSETLISPEACVTCTNERGEIYIRLDEPTLDDDAPIPAGRSTYPFGQNVAGSRNGIISKGGSDVVGANTPTTKNSHSTTTTKESSFPVLTSSGSREENCIFVLSPALANLLQLGGEEIQMLTNLNQNPYRKAIIQSLVAPYHMTDLGQLAVSTVDVALSRFDTSFISEILLGRDLRTFSDDIPYESSMHEDTYSHYDDFGIWGGNTNSQAAAASLNGAVSRHSDLRMSRNINRVDLFQGTTADIVSHLCDSVMIASPGPFGTWKLHFDDVAAHSLLHVIWRDRNALSTATKRIERRLRQSALLFSEIPPRIPTSQHLGLIIYSMFYELGSKSLIEDLLLLNPKSKSSDTNEFIDPCLHAAVSCHGTFDDRCQRAVNMPSTQYRSGIGSPDENAVTAIGVTSARSLLKFDALSTLLTDLADSECLTISETPCPSGLAFSRDGSPIETTEGVFDLSLKQKLQLQVFSPLSDQLWTLLTNSHSDDKMPRSGQLVELTGLTALPCVCEAKSNGNDDGVSRSAKIVAEGITWQSLYLVFSGPYMLLAEPDGGVGGGDGRVVASALISRLSVEKDKNPPESTSPARRLLVHHEWLDITPLPGLFTVNTKKSRSPRQNNSGMKRQGKKFGPLSGAKMVKSSLDVWFENENTCAHAYRSFQFKISTAKTRRGDEILEYLSRNQL